jgi:ABC-type uncharacterized transport system permease subunit
MNVLFAFLKAVLALIVTFPVVTIIRWIMELTLFHMPDQELHYMGVINLFLMVSTFIILFGLISAILGPAVQEKVQQWRIQ